ncbi:uncharacterized protein LOC134816414 [Bolinopsis microptera]|uniref:uncharacterized protein LOC134816414 n=1 Tax=Bolinopsis microptera TaxID=2820187 RepID=UPI00307921C4
MNGKERMKEDVISDDDFVDTRNVVKMNRKERMKVEVISDDEVKDEVTLIKEIISDDEFVDNDKEGKKTAETLSENLRRELKKKKRFRSLSTVPTKNLESEVEKELSSKRKHTVKPQKAINPLKEITLTDPDTSSSFSPRKSERIAANESILEKSSIYFSPGETDPRVKAIAARTKSALLSCDSELKERASKGENFKKWDRLFNVFGSMIEERELTTEDWEDSALVWKFDKNVMDPRLLEDSCSDSDEEFEIVNPDDKFERSSKEANGKELADFITGQSNTIKKKLIQPRETKTAAHISGSMSADICQGKFSNYKNTMTVKVFGLDLKFSTEYLDILKAMTGVDMRRSAVPDTDQCG